MIFQSAAQTRATKLGSMKLDSNVNLMRASSFIFHLCHSLIERKHVRIRKGNTSIPIRHPETLSPMTQPVQKQVKPKKAEVERSLASTGFELSLYSWGKPVSTTYLADLDLSLHSELPPSTEDTPPQPWFGNRLRQLLRT